MSIKTKLSQGGNNSSIFNKCADKCTKRKYTLINCVFSSLNSHFGSLSPVIQNIKILGSMSLGVAHPALSPLYCIIMAQVSIVLGISVRFVSSKGVLLQQGIHCKNIGS